MVAASFIRNADDVRVVKQVIEDSRSDAWVIAKLEKPQAVEDANLEEILDVADGVMVARGDLGVEMPPEKVPIIQKRVISRAGEWRKPVITATQMLESMTDHPRPTRAEASDVANAILDGSDAVMLSAETASGEDPREAVAIMARIILEAESNAPEPVRRRHQARPLSISETICESVAHAAQDLAMKAIAVYTETGTTARLISKYRPKAATFAFASKRSVGARLNLLWGVQPVLSNTAASAEEMVVNAERHMVKSHAADPGDVIAIVAGTSTTTGSTNFMRLHVVGAGQQSALSRQRSAPKNYRG
jgi:pyruvate kinase